VSTEVAFWNSAECGILCGSYFNSAEFCISITSDFWNMIRYWQLELKTVVNVPILQYTFSTWCRKIKALSCSIKTIYLIISRSIYRVCIKFRVKVVVRRRSIMTRLRLQWKICSRQLQIRIRLHLVDLTSNNAIDLLSKGANALFEMEFFTTQSKAEFCKL
jgi:hypothetical protein